MKNQTVSEKLEALVKLQKIDSSLDNIKKLRGDLPEEVQDMEDEIEGCKARMARFDSELLELQDKVKKYKDEMNKAEDLIKKYSQQQKNVKNNREYNAITKELEIQELEIQICEKREKECKEKIQQKKDEIQDIEKVMHNRIEELDSKKKGLNKLLSESEVEETSLLEERKKAVNKIESKLLKYYERLRSSLSNGLAVVTVVRGAAEGCNIVIPPQKIAEIREKNKIVIDEHSGRILASVDMESMKTEKEKKNEVKKRNATKKLSIKKKKKLANK